MAKLTGFERRVLRLRNNYLAKGKKAEDAGNETPKDKAVKKNGKGGNNRAAD